MLDNYPLIIDKRGSTLSIRDGQLKIKTENDTQHVPLNLIRLVIIAVTCQVTTSLLQTLAEHEIVVVILPSRGKGQTAWLTPGLSSSWQIRQQQYRYQHIPELAWFWIERKLHAQRHTLTLLGQPLGILETIEKPATLQLDTLMGLEGTAARHYFQQLAKVLPEAWGFSGRNRQPPQDPFNALLSLSYTLFTTEAIMAVQAQGFDPWVGFLHQPYPGRPSLALDLIEPFRPQIDLWCIAMAQSELDPEEHFNQTEDGVLLNKKGRNLYFSAWAQDRQNWHQDKSAPQLLNQLMIEFKQTLQAYEGVTEQAQPNCNQTPF